MGIGRKVKARAGDKAKDVAKRSGLKLVHGKNHCNQSPSNVHQWGREIIVTEDDDGGKHKFTLLTCRHGCGAYKD